MSEKKKSSKVTSEAEDEGLEATKEHQSSDVVEEVKGERGVKGALREILVKWEGCGTHLTWEMSHQLPKGITAEWNEVKKSEASLKQILPLVRYCMDNLEHTLYRALGRVADQEEITLDYPRQVFRATFKIGKLETDEKSEHKDWYVIQMHNYLKWQSALPFRDLKSGRVRIIDFPFYARMSIRKAGPSVQETVIICVHKMEVDAIPGSYPAYTCGCY